MASSSPPRPKRRIRTSVIELTAIAAAVALVLSLGAGAWIAAVMVSAFADHAHEAASLSAFLTRLDALGAQAVDADSEYRNYVHAPDPARLKTFNERVGALQKDFQEALKGAGEDPRAHADLAGAREILDKQATVLRGAMNSRQAGEASQEVERLPGLAPALRDALAPVHRKYGLALEESRNRSRQLASYLGFWLLATWLFAAAVGAAIAGLAIRQARAISRLNRRLQRESIYDSLTGLPNFVYLEEWLTRSLARAARVGSRVGVLYIDINSFKQVNEALGYPEGDRVLLEFAAKLKAMTRSSDFVARVRNDNFAIVMPDVGEMKDLESAMKRFAAVSVVRSGSPIQATVGAAIFPEHAEVSDNLLRLSRAAMYRNRLARRAA